MILSILSSLCLFFGLKVIWGDFNFLDAVMGVHRQRKSLLHVEALLRELEETLMAGLVPDAQRWGLLSKLHEPWGRLTSESLLELRSSGAALLPTLQRLRSLAEEHAQALEDARAKSAQALAQAVACGCLLPIVGVTLHILLPGVQQHPWVWGGSCLVSGTAMSIGIIWMMRMSEVARWGGLSIEKRNWVISSQCAGERFLALVRMGTPQDLSWAKTCEFLSGQSPALAHAWGYSVWEIPKYFCKTKAEEVIVSAGSSIRKAVQVSLMEGRPCVDRVEASLRALRLGIKSQIERELSLLGTQALKPLFICIGPAILGLLFIGIWLSSMDQLAEMTTHGF